MYSISSQIYNHYALFGPYGLSNHNKHAVLRKNNHFANSILIVLCVNHYSRYDTSRLVMCSRKHTREIDASRNKKITVAETLTFIYFNISWRKTEQAQFFLEISDDYTQTIHILLLINEAIWVSRGRVN